MDRRKFLKKTAAAALAAGTAFTLPSCDDDWPTPTPKPNDKSHDNPDQGKNMEMKQSALFTASDRHEMGSGNYLPALLAKAVSQTEVKPEVVLLGGDYVGGGRDMTPVFSIDSLYNEVYAVLEPATTDVLYTYGSHDNCCSEGYSAFFSGPHRCDGYYIYGISYLQGTCATDPFDVEATAEKLHRLLQLRGLKVLIMKQPCATMTYKGSKEKRRVWVDQSKCLGDGCGCDKFCSRVWGCPGNSWDFKNNKAVIDTVSCVGCGVCAKLCPAGAIQVEGGEQNA